MASDAQVEGPDARRDSFYPMYQEGNKRSGYRFRWMVDLVVEIRGICFLGTPTFSRASPESGKKVLTFQCQEHHLLLLCSHPPTSLLCECVDFQKLVTGHFSLSFLFPIAVSPWSRVRVSSLSFCVVHFFLMSSPSWQCGVTHSHAISSHLSQFPFSSHDPLIQLLLPLVGAGFFLMLWSGCICH